MIGMLTVPMMMLPGLVGLPGRGSIGYSSSLTATNMASLPDDASQDEQRVTWAEEPRRADAVSRKVLCRNKEGGKSLGVGGRKQIIDFCQYTIRLSPIFKVFVSEK